MRIARALTIDGSHREADEMDVTQQLAMTPDQRRLIVRELQRRVFGPNPPGLRSRTARRK
ncbi:MAG: hypothetical protein NTU88_09855 [Armatimonadetes bacterium]|nr:hypothetical protein [Armatimonadota bacterium]